MTNKNTHILRIILLTVFIALIISRIFIVYDDFIVRKMVDELLFDRNEFVLEYNGEFINMENRTFNSNFTSRFVIPKRTFYFGSFDSTAKYIRITIPKKITITIYPNDDTSVLVDFNRYYGLRRKYKLTGSISSVDDHLEILYEVTGEEIFYQLECKGLKT